MTVLGIHESQVESIVAAGGRFFITPNTSPVMPQMFDLSAGLLDTYGYLLNDGQGLLIQIGEDAAGNTFEANDPKAPRRVKVFSLGFDGSQADSGFFGWRYTAAVPDIGRTVQELYVTPDNLEGSRLDYDQQGSLRRQDELLDTGPLAVSIQQIITGNLFRRKAETVQAERKKSENKLAKYALELAEVGLPTYKIEKKLEKPTKEMLARGFVGIRPIQIQNT